MVSDGSSADVASFDVFLCHSSTDAALVHAIYCYLSNQGKAVYVDWIHHGRKAVPPRPHQLAKRLKASLRQSDTLLYLHTSASCFSQWCPWEVGFFDAHRPGHIFVADLTQAPRPNFIVPYPEWPNALPHSVFADKLTRCPAPMTDCSTLKCSTTPLAVSAPNPSL